MEYDVFPVYLSIDLGTLDPVIGPPLQRIYSPCEVVKRDGA